jgi:predicted DNA-binding ribbon-helix-helix protein
VTGRPEKPSVTLQGHRTSVSLETEFWAEFRAMAEARGLSVNALAAQIDAARGDVGLASAIRVAVLMHLKAARDEG